MFLLPAMVIVDSPQTAAAISVDLAKTDHAVFMRGATREDALIVALTRDGSVWFGSGKLPPEVLPAAIREALSRGAERKVYIRADARAKYGRVREVLEKVRLAGVEKVAFLVWKRDRPYSAP